MKDITKLSRFIKIYFAFFLIVKCSFSYGQTFNEVLIVNKDDTSFLDNSSPISLRESQLINLLSFGELTLISGKSVERKLGLTNSEIPLIISFNQSQKLSFFMGVNSSFLKETGSQVRFNSLSLTSGINYNPKENIFSALQISKPILENSFIPEKQSLQFDQKIRVKAGLKF
ncbi:hypothetical protein DCS32_06865 [Dokdonia sp. Dokd-P16]|uniref:hypothetical protein n=1 Tax=Dokdonia sp. Dokd-P16 TaxID=2173169 RepID=UPI000D543BC9|nr:hypothetical protein [Dokdonia sp. Dokd-P16]AWH73885.1 hypothetical protein DCS32_06865 [Dokdonia sp. Dokd-P16]